MPRVLVSSVSSKTACFHRGRVERQFHFHKKSIRINFEDTLVLATNGSLEPRVLGISMLELIRSLLCGDDDEDPYVPEKIKFYLGIRKSTATNAET